MKKIVKLFLLPALFFSFFAQTIVAAENANKQKAQTNNAKSAVAKPVAVAIVLQRLHNGGYLVYSIEYKKDDNSYSVGAYDPQGRKQDLKIDAKKGMVDLKNNAKHVTMLQAVRKVEKSGVGVTSAETSDDSYKVTGVDKSNNEVTQKVNMDTGEVTKD